MLGNQIFKDKLRKALKRELPGKSSHLRLAPKDRVSGIKRQAQSSNPKKSSVLLVLFNEDEELKILFILRSVYDGAHSGQISFPGGQFDLRDENSVDTALRETFEEVGVRVEPEQILGQLSTMYIPPSNFLVETFVAFIPEISDLVLDAKEVQKAFKIPIRSFIKEDAIQVKTVLSRNKKEIKAPCFYIDGLKIWGATAMILNELLDIIKPKL
jgi:8-oxo-dGTP pyrophosphatase MutT (NUDIX family)